MFLPNDCDCLLGFPSSSDCVKYITANRDRTIFVIVTDTSLYFYLSGTRLLSFVCERDRDDIQEKGVFKKAYWKPDSSAICVTTTKNFLNIYSVELHTNQSPFNLHDPLGVNTELARESPELFLPQNRCSVIVNLAVVARLEAAPTSVISFKEQTIIVCLADGWLHRLSWDGNVQQELSFNIRSVSHHQHSPKKDDQFVIDIAPFLGGICIVLDDGHGCLLVSSDPNFQPATISAIWAFGISDACCCSSNIRYRLVYFGCKNGDIAGYSIDDLNGALIQIFRIHLSIKNSIEYLDKFCSVRQIACLTPQGSAFAVIWNAKSTELTQEKVENLSSNDEQNDGLVNAIPPALALFSPFGEQLWCSLEDITATEDEHFSTYTTIDWSVDGYQMWIGTSGDGVKMMNLIHSADQIHNRLVMVGAGHIYLGPSDNSDQLLSTAPHLTWQTLKAPHNYISANWPIKFVAVDCKCERVVAIAGTHGFCYYNLRSSKWRIFRKEVQEKSLLLTGGLLVFNEFILCSATYLEAPSDESEQIFSFLIGEQLDIDMAKSIVTLSRVLRMSLCGTHLLTFDINSTISVYRLSSLEQQRENQLSQISIHCLAEIRIVDFLPHPTCLISMELAKLNFYTDGLSFCEDLDSLLINVSGHLLLLTPMQPQIEPGEDIPIEFQLHPPTLVATCVENFWIVHPLEERCKRIPYLNQALLINAGCKKSRIWLPLSAEQNIMNYKNQKNGKGDLQKQRKFMTRRIMLPFELGVYPISIDGDFLVCGVNCISQNMHTSESSICTSSSSSRVTEDMVQTEIMTTSNRDNVGKKSKISIYSIARISEVFIHKLLKELLKRNLGAYAFGLASACRSLSYFNHILELLLHDLLDEEATSSEPIPDPLLPTVVSFLREFPSEYLQTIIFCARKTELAFWNLLFSISHHPRQLFQMCLQEGQLETATSCLIVLHSMENMQDCSKLAFQLLDEALSKRKWTVAQDIVRFMQNINQATENESFDVENEPESPLQQKLSSLGHHHQTKQSFTAFAFPSDEFNFPLFSSQMETSNDVAQLSHMQRRRSGSGKIPDPNPKQLSRQYSKPVVSAQHRDRVSSKLSCKMPSPVTENAQKEHRGSVVYSQLDEILTKYASSLLEDYALRDLGAFSSYLPFDFVVFFRRPESSFSFCPKEFPLVLMKLHAQFNWPYPMSLSNSDLLKNSTSSEGSICKNGRMDSLNELNSLIGENHTLVDKNKLQQNFDSVSTISSATDRNSEAALVFDWRIMEKFCERSKSRGTEQAEAELCFVFVQLKKAKAFEWLYLLSILRQDIRHFKEHVVLPMQQLSNGKDRQQQFLNAIMEGTAELHLWAQTKCPAYATVVHIFKEFVENF